MAWLGANQWEPKTWNNYRTDLRTLFQWGIEQKYLSINPYDAVPRKKIADGEIAFMAVDDIERLLHRAAMVKPGALRRDKTGQWEEQDLERVDFRDCLVMAVLGFFCGMRPERELGEMEEDSIRDDVVWVRGKLAKSRGRRVIELSENAREWLKLCPLKKGKIKPKNSGLSLSHTELRRKAGWCVNSAVLLLVWRSLQEGLINTAVLYSLPRFGARGIRPLQFLNLLPQVAEGFRCCALLLCHLQGRVLHLSKSRSPSEFFQFRFESYLRHHRGCASTGWIECAEIFINGCAGFQFLQFRHLYFVGFKLLKKPVVLFFEGFLLGILGHFERLLALIYGRYALFIDILLPVVRERPQIEAIAFELAAFSDKCRRIILHGVYCRFDSLL